MVLLSTHNICFWLKNEKSNFQFHALYMYIKAWYIRGGDNLANSSNPSQTVPYIPVWIKAVQASG